MMAPPKGPRPPKIERPDNAVAWLALPLSLANINDLASALAATYGGELNIAGGSDGIWLLQVDDESDSGPDDGEPFHRARQRAAERAAERIKAAG